jgi:hypothetical protein
MRRFYMDELRLTIDGGVLLLPFFHGADGERKYRGHHRDAWMSAEATAEGGSYSYRVRAFCEEREGSGVGPISAALADIFAAIDGLVEAKYAEERAYYREYELAGVRVYASAKGL